MPTIPNSNANCNAISTGMTEAAFPNSNPTLPAPLLLVLGTIYFFGPPIFNWRFPCQTLEELNLLINKLEALIEDNSSLGNDVLGPHTKVFKSSLESLNDKASKIEILSYREPDRMNVFVWVRFRWSLLRDVDECYRALRRLNGEVK
ncbi:hypothetical protein Moror_2224, partial [Moniliophthora roreri MCA 2997]